MINKAAILELESSSKGLLFPRVNLINTTTWSLAAGSTATAGMMVYNIKTVASGFSGTTAYPAIAGDGTGIYYWDGTGWVATRGLKGTDGKSITGAAGAPGATTPGNDGDIYINTTNGDTYIKQGNTWVLNGNIKGATGDPGVVGVQGLPGTSGTPGTPGSGTPGAPGAGVTIVTNDSGTWVYNPTTGTWTNINGPKGDKGDAGVVGVQGLPGTSGTPGTPGSGTPGAPGAGVTIVTNDSGTWVYNPTTGTWTNINGTAGPTGATGAFNGTVDNGLEFSDLAKTNIQLGGDLIKNTIVNLNTHSLLFDSPERRIRFDNNGRIGTEAKGANDADIYASSGTGPTYNRFDIQSFPSGQVNLTATGAVGQLAIATHLTALPAPILFSTSPGGVSGVERMRITGTGNVGVNTIDPTEKLDNDGITRLRNLPLNGATNAINTTTGGGESSSQDQTFTATRTVVADANGVLGTVAGLPANPVNIYNSNGTLTNARTVTLGGFPLNFAGTEQTVALNSLGWLQLNGQGSNSSFMRMTTTDGNANGIRSNFDMQLFPDNMMQLYATDEVSKLSIGTHQTLNPSPVEFATSPGANAPGQVRMTITPTGEVAIGATSAPSFVVGSTTIQPKLHVDGDISTTGKLWTTNSVYADYVFEDYFNGFSKIYKDYKFKSLKEVAEFIKKNKHLPGVTPINEINVGKNGYTIDLTQLSMQQLEKLEELYLHVIEMNDALSQKDKEIKALQNKTNDLEERLKKLEQLLHNKQ